jgi:hypothetical protein
VLHLLEYNLDQNDACWIFMALANYGREGLHKPKKQRVLDNHTSTEKLLHFSTDEVLLVPKMYTHHNFFAFTRVIVSKKGRATSAITFVVRPHSSNLVKVVPTYASVDCIRRM